MFFTQPAIVDQADTKVAAEVRPADRTEIGARGAVFADWTTLLAQGAGGGGMGAGGAPAQASRADHEVGAPFDPYVCHKSPNLARKPFSVRIGTGSRMPKSGFHAICPYSWQQWPARAIFHPHLGLAPRRRPELSRGIWFPSSRIGAINMVRPAGAAHLPGRGAVS